ncbi:LUC7-domain-containing protein [Meira miltonrushii]|uniref:LUC7-domain-containing protein n=1 Tax=Meira miltonrushii TaxID=1280837 RepID=A0A316V8Z4_9BASI|nr:LUC7-domain-containing protein [Meira miltonrushii]PWN33714.1 LUC7-domain-containing protein [Meira miltonrushii]
MGRKAEVQRALLEKLMGPEAMGLTTQQLHFTDDKVCKNFLCGTCPHDLFSNTKVDLGTCPRSHLSKLKEEYTSAIAKGEQYPTFEAEYEDNIRAFMADIDRKIAANKRRIDQTPEETQKFTNLMRDIADVEKAMNDAMAEVERLGEQGQIEESLAELQKAEALKVEKADREKELQVLSDTAGASGHQKLRVCDVCGAYLSILDSDRRLADHFGGRMHLGYVKLRDVIVEFDARRDRGEDPRRLIAAGGYTNGHSAGARPSQAYPPSSSSYRPPEDDYRYNRSDRDRSDRRDYRDRDRYDRQRSRSPPPRSYR